MNIDTELIDAIDRLCGPEQLWPGDMIQYTIKMPVKTAQSASFRAALLAVVAAKS